MTCMKCGRDVKEQQVFCDECLGIMDAYPVKPGTPIQLPTPPAKNTGAPKTNKKKAKKPEDQIRQLRSSLRWMTVLYILTLLALIVAVLLLLFAGDPNVIKEIPAHYRFI